LQLSDADGKIAMDVLMPQLGETVAEGKITKWFKSAGDAVKPGENLFEVETDKVSMEVPAIEGGLLDEIRVPVGEIAAVGAVVAVIVDKAGATAGAPDTMMDAPPKAPAAPPRTTAMTSIAPPKARAPVELDPFHEVRTPARNYGPAKLANGLTVTPLARRLATESGIDLGGISPSGAHGRIMARDVEAAIAKPARHPDVGGAPTAALAAGPSAERVKALYAPGSYAEIPLDAMRRTIAARLTEASHSIPQFHLSIDVTIDRLLEVREEANALARKRDDGTQSFKLSLNDFVIKALALALQRVPAANAAWADDRILRFKSSDIGVAVAINGGLITPVIRAAETKSMTAISTEMKDFAERARARRLKPHEYQGGATTISNLGMYGIREFSAIINPPQATILAVGAGQRRPAETADSAVRFVNQMTATLSCDHRVVDGALGAELLAAFKDLLQHPVGLML
jgi:pyruvate dehydrogenase E2 component (dihydrolipoamide acetyltransferase)